MISGQRATADGSIKRGPAGAIAWADMGEASIIAAAELTWQSSDETATVIGLFHKITGRTVPLPTWRNFRTWRAATLLSLGAEQLMNCLLAKRDLKTVEHGHDLMAPWRRLDRDDREIVAVWARDIGRRVRGSKLALPYLDAARPTENEWGRFIEETLKTHRYTHTNSRYFAKDGKPPLTKNIELWRVALALYRAACPPENYREMVRIARGAQG